MLLCWPKVEGWRIEGLGRWVSLASELAGALTRTNSHAARQESPGLIHRASPYHPIETPAVLFPFHPRTLTLLTRPRPPRASFTLPFRIESHTPANTCAFSSLFLSFPLSLPLSLFPSFIFLCFASPFFFLFVLTCFSNPTRAWFCGSWICLGLEREVF